MSAPQPEQDPGAGAKTVHINQADVRTTTLLEPYTEFGAYTILTELGRGGMGVVYGARHRTLHRRVALKVMKSGAMATFDETERFRREAEAAAKLNHPHIVPIFEIGQHDGCAFFSMQYVEGETLSDFNKAAKDRNADWMRQCADMMAKVARAVQHAHEHLVLHRDLKPGNILLDEKGEPHVTDFGLAKLLESGEQQTLTETGLGTPEYMSPEQAWGNSRDLTTATDVFSLGAVLYHLLTGAFAFKGETPLETLEKVRHRAPAPLRAINPLVPRDLEVICLKCLEKEPAHRYSSAGALADEMERWLGGRPILARPANVAERAWKWVRRNPRLTKVSCVAVVIAIIGVVASTWQWRLAEGQRVQTVVLKTRLETQRAEDFFKGENPSLALAQLARVLRRDPGNHIAASRLINALNQRKFLVQVSAPLGTGVRFASLAQPGALITAGVEDQTTVVQLWRGDASSPKRFLHGTERVLAAACSLDGQLLATGSESGGYLWRTTTGALITRIPFDQPIQAIHFQAQPSNGTPMIAFAGTNSVMSWNTGTHAVSETLSFSNDSVLVAAFTPDHSRIALAMESGYLVLRQPGKSAPYVVTNAHTNVIRSLRFSVDYQRLISASADGTAKLWDATTGQLIMVFRGRHALLDADLSSDGSRAVTAARDGTAQLWNSGTGQRMGAAMPHPGEVNAARFSPDGALLVTGAEDGITRLWSGVTGQLLHETVRATQPISDVAFSEDGRWILRVADGGTAGLLACVGGRSAEPYPVPPSVLSAKAAEPAKTPPSMDLSRFASARAAKVTFADLSTDGTLVAIGYANQTARIWNVATRQPLGDSMDHESPVNCVRFSSDGTLLVTRTLRGKIRVWDARSGQPLTDWFTAIRPVSEVFLFTDNKRIATAEGEGWNIFIAGGDTPDWLPELAEAVAGVRYSASGVTEMVVGPALRELREKLQQAPATNSLVDRAREYLHELTFFPNP